MRQLIPGPSDDVPPPQPLMDRRRTPDRRTTWRGGRRDSDWLNRPAGALSSFEVRQEQQQPWWTALANMMLW